MTTVRVSGGAWDVRGEVVTPAVRVLELKGVKKKEDSEIDSHRCVETKALSFQPRNVT